MLSTARTSRIMPNQSGIWAIQSSLVSGLPGAGAGAGSAVVAGAGAVLAAGAALVCPVDMLAAPMITKIETMATAIHEKGTGRDIPPPCRASGLPDAGMGRFRARTDR